MDDLDLRHLLYHRTAEEGRVPDVDDLATATDRDPGDVVAALRRLADDHHALVLTPDRERIRMLNPFAAVPTDFRVASGDTTWYGNCIWDAVAIPELVGRDAIVTTGCPDCGEELHVGVTSEGEVGPVDAIAHVAVPASDWWEDIGHT